MKQGKHIPTDKELFRRRLKLQKELRELISIGSGKSNAFWIIYAKMAKVQLRIYNRSKKRSRVTIHRK